jgi:uncharacterized lipoprotein NlpE involved in copper resistance
MKKLIAASSLLMLALLTGCGGGAGLRQASDGTYLSNPAHPAAAQTGQSAANAE